MEQRDDVDELTSEQRERLKRYRRRLWWGIPAGVAGVFIGGAVARFTLPAPRPGHHTPPSWLLGLAIAVTLVFLIGLQYLIIRRRFLRPGTARDLIVSGNPKDIRRVVKQLRHRQAIAEPDLPIVRAFLNSARRQRRTWPWVVGVLTLFLIAEVIIAVVQPGLGVNWFAIASLAFALVLLSWSYRLQRRAVSGAQALGLTANESDSARRGEAS